MILTGESPYNELGSYGLLSDLMSEIYPSRWIRSRGLDLDPWQAQVADGTAQTTIICCTRQAGKTEINAALVANMLETRERSLTLILAPSERQSQELLIKSRAYIDWDYVRPQSVAAKSVVLQNGSRAFALPGADERTIRGFSAPDLIIVDEAAMASDDLYYAIRPMIATNNTKARVIILSSPKGRRGFFFEEFHAPDDPNVLKIKITADDIPRISQEFLDQERRRMPEWLFRQEYYCEFVDNEMQVFGTDLVGAAFVRGRGDAALNIESGIQIPTNGIEAVKL